MHHFEGANELEDVAHVVRRLRIIKKLARHMVSFHMVSFMPSSVGVFTSRAHAMAWLQCFRPRKIKQIPSRLGIQSGKKRMRLGKCTHDCGFYLCLREFNFLS